MAMTETRTVEPDTAPVTQHDTTPPPEPRGLYGWLTTADHKRVGRMYLATSVVFLVVGSVVGGIIGVERIDTGLDILDGGTFGQVYTLHGEVAVLLFLVPFFIGLATYLVPLQVGASTIAFPRGAAAGYWGYLISGGLLVGAYAANGGPGGGSQVGVDLYLLSLLTLNLAALVAMVGILTTALGLRAPGMTLLRTPLFTWSMVVGGSLFVITAPVLMANVVHGYVDHHFGGDGAAYGAITWFWSVPQVFLLAVPVAGVVAEIVPVLSRNSLRRHGSLVVVIGLMGVLGVGAWAQVPETFDDLLYVAIGLAAVLPVLALVGLLGETLRGGRPELRAPLLLAMGAVVHLLLGALAGATLVIEPLELEGTVWEAAQVHYTLYGGALLGAFAALWYWAPKIWGNHLGEAAGKAVFALTFFGAILLAAPDLVNGLFENRVLLDPGFEEDGLTVAMNGVSALGGVLGVLGVLVAFGDLLGSVVRRKGRPAGDNPWGGSTLEWSTSSPPPAGNFSSPIEPVTSPTPLGSSQVRDGS